MHTHIHMIDKIEFAARHLECTERGQMTCKQLLDFLKSSDVQGLDQRNSEAVTTLVTCYMMGRPCHVLEALSGVVRRNMWVEGHR